VNKSEEILNNVGESLKQIRKGKDMSQKEVAVKMGVNPNQYSRIETNGVVPSLKTLLKVAEVLEVTVDEILYGYQNKKQAVIKDQELLEAMDVINNLPPGDQFVAKEMLNLIVAKTELKNIASKFSGIHPDFKG